eukprot:5421921-Amphidinium_carterae.1
MDFVGDLFTQSILAGSERESAINHSSAARVTRVLGSVATFTVALPLYSQFTPWCVVGHQKGLCNRNTFVVSFH